MTVSSTTSKVSYTGNGLTTAFAVPFYFLEAADLQVILRTGTTETVQALTTNYTVTGAGVSSGGTVTMLTAPAAAVTVTIRRNIEATQETDLLPNDRLPAESLETALDKVTMLTQQLGEESARSIKFPASDAAMSSQVPAASARASKFLSFDASGIPQATVDSSVLSQIPDASTRANKFLSFNASGAAITTIGTDATLSVFVQSGTGATPRSVNSKLGDDVSPLDFGAVGDADESGTSGTNDAAAFALLEAAHQNKVVNLAGKIYLVNSPIPTANNYINGKLVVAAASTDDQPVNFAFGYRALRVNNYVPLQWPAGGGIDYASGNYNTAIGDNALQANTTGRRNTALGSFALYSNNTGYYNTAIGPLALYDTTTGSENTAIGVQASQSNISGSDNVSVGSGAMSQHSTSNDCVAIGRQALQIAPASTSRVVAIGRQAAWQYTTGVDTVAIGYQALSNAGANGSYNVAIGSAAMGAATTADSTIAIGRRALAANTAGDGNVAIGNDAMVSATGGDNNVSIGNSVNPNNTTGSNNVFIGLSAATANADGSSNVVVGRSSFVANTSGSNNVIIGEQAGTTNTTGIRNTYVGSGAGTSGTTYNETSAFGYNAQVTGSFQVQLGDSATTTYAYGAVQNRSDARDKADIRDTVLGLGFINALRPVDFRWDYREDYGWGGKDGSKKRARFHHGIIAQELKAACDSAGVEFGGLQDHSLVGGRDVLSVGYAELVGPLIKAVQELSAEVDSLKSYIKSSTNE